MAANGPNKRETGEIYRRMQDGQKPNDIARAMNIVPESVERWCKHFSKKSTPAPRGTGGGTLQAKKGLPAGASE